MKIRRVTIHAPHLTGKRPIVKATTSLITPERAGLLTKLMRAKKELLAWNSMGRKVAPKEIRQARAEACRGCGYYEATGNFGMGECTAPGCGCSRVKQALLTATCPHPEGSRWPAT